MQSLTAPPRDSLTATQIIALITGPTVTVSTGLELLAQDLTVVQDISDDLLSGKVSRNCDATIHGTVSLQLSRELSWGTDLVHPYVLLDPDGLAVRFDLGVFSLTTPEQTFAESPQTFACQGYDRLYLLNRQVGDSYQVAAGTDVLTAVRQAVSDAGLSGVLLDGSASGQTLPTAMVWPLVGQATDGSSTGPTTWLRIINDLLTTISYRGVWADWDGIFRSGPYVDPSVRGVEWTLDEGATSTIQGEDRTLTQDMWQTPNRWVFTQSNRDPAAAAPSEGDGIYTVNNVSDGPTSQDARGLVWAQQYTYDVSSQASLQALGDQRVAADKRVASAWSLKGMGPLPTVWHYDVMTLMVAGGTYKVQGNSWDMDLITGLIDYQLDGVG